MRVLQPWVYLVMVAIIAAHGVGSQIDKTVGDFSSPVACIAVILFLPLWNLTL